MADGRRTRGRGRIWSALTRGDRPFAFVLVALVAVVAVMALGPLQVFTASADRVDELEDRRDRLRDEVDSLEDRQRRLEDPEELELLARSELGLVRPGEIPFIVAEPEDDSPRINVGEESPVSDADEQDAWYRRLGRWLGERFSDDGS